MTMSVARSNGMLSSSSSVKTSSLRSQLKAALTLYEGLARLYFVLVEARAATATASAKAQTTAHIRELRSSLIGSDGGQGALASLREQHAERVRALAVFQPFLPAPSTNGTLVAPAALSSASTPTIPSVAVALDVMDAIMAELIDRGRTHAANQARISSLVGGIEARQARIIETIEQLAHVRKQANHLVKTGEEEEKAIKRAEQHPLDYSEVLRYGRALSQTTTAPPRFKFKLDTQAKPGEERAAADGAADVDQADVDAATAQNREQSDDAAGERHPSSQIPEHLQDKLPFPSVDAMRRGASELPLPTWEQFQQGMLAQPTEQDETGADIAKPASQAAPIAQASQRAQPVETRGKAQPEDEDEGFGLDLN